MRFSVTARETGKIAVLELSGRLVMGEACTALDSQMKSLIDGGQFSLLLECSRVEAIDSQGIEVLVRYLNILQKCGGKLGLVKLSPRMREVLEIARLLPYFHSFDDEAAALQSFTA